MILLVGSINDHTCRTIKLELPPPLRGADFFAWVVSGHPMALNKMVSVITVAREATSLGQMDD